MQYALVRFMQGMPGDAAEVKLPEVFYFVLVLLMPALLLLVRRPMATARGFLHFLLLLQGARSKFTRTSLARIHYLEAGMRNSPERAIVLLTGLGGNAADWQVVVPKLAQRFRVYSVELAGQGRTRLLDESRPYRLDTQITLLLEFLDRMGLSSAILIGISLGGWIACRFALQNPARVQRLVLIASAGLRPDLQMHDMQPSTRKEALIFGNRLLARKRWIPGFVLDDLIRRLNSPANCKTLQSLEEGDLLDGSLPAVIPPVDLIWGDTDDLIPLAHGQRFQTAIPGSRLHVLPDCGHVPLFECRHAFRVLLCQVLNQPAPVQK